MSELSSDKNPYSLIAAGMSRYDRRKKATKQPRDFSGRWVAAGANVRWRSNGQDWAGTVEEIKNGKAVVKVRHSDGSESTTTLNPESLKVMASKARLSSVNQKYFDGHNNVGDYIKKNRKSIEEAAAKGGARIDREDGYSIEATNKPIDGDGDGILNEAELPADHPARKDDEEDKGKGKKPSNPLIFQLYAPNGKSLGIFDPGKGGEQGMEDAIGSDSGEAPAPAPAPVAVVSDASPRAYSVPKAVRETILAELSDNTLPMADEDVEFFTRFCSGEPVSKDDIRLFKGFMEVVQSFVRMFGGIEGHDWAEKIDTAVEEYEPIGHDFESGQFEYFVTQDERGFTDLIAVDMLHDEVLSWTGRDFTMSHGSVSKFDAHTIIPLDEFTAREIAYKLHDDLASASRSEFSVQDIFPHERNLFEMALTELDTNFLDEVSALNYLPVERSIDAQHQPRAEGGKFGKQYTEGMADGSGEAKYFAIVDSVDPTAVLDVVAIATDASGQPVIHRRSFGQWSPDTEIHSQLTGPTPPPVVYLDSEDQVKEVLAQVDAYDSEQDAPETGETELSLKLDLKKMSLQSEILDEDLHEVLRKARKLNRMDLVPEDYRAYAATSASEGLYGEHGEVITASASRLGQSALERLDNYWTKGAGARKIDWDSTDAVAYAAKTFAKYLGEDRAYAYASILKNRANL